MTMGALGFSRSRADFTPVLSVRMKAATDSELPPMMGILVTSNSMPGNSMPGSSSAGGQEAFQPARTGRGRPNASGQMWDKKRGESNQCANGDT